MIHQPHGTWRSPLPAALVAEQGLRLSSVAIDGADIYWVEGRSTEGGRNVIVRRRPDGSTVDVVPAGFNARTRVHEYGGTAYAVFDGSLYFSNFGDQRIYRVSVDPDEGTSPSSGPGRTPVPVTPDGPWRFADFSVDRFRRRLIAVREEHPAGGDERCTDGSHAGSDERTGDRGATEPINTLVAIPLDGGTAGEVLAAGHDFYSAPRLSGDGRRLAWLAWRHPHMPWDGTELWVADVAGDGAVVNARCVAGGDAESIYQPGWTPDGALIYTSDRDGWWKLYSATADGSPVPIVADAPEDAEFGRPQWVFGSASWSPAGASRIVASYTRGGRWHLAAVDLASGAWTPLGGALEPREWMTADERQLVMIAASPMMADAVVRVDLQSAAHDVLRASSTVTLEAGDISVAEPMTFTTGDGERAHAFYYAPRNSRFAGPADERPPLIAIGHGGPTTAATGTLDLRIQYWTTRGFAVVDVNYRGSSGYGRPYRERLDGQWGVVDVNDMVNAARHLVDVGTADPRRLAIRGGSAGGYTALAALTMHPGVFTAAASYYGISDIEVLARDTHKFESRYLDRLVGPYPERRDLYRARSPIHHVDRIACPLILFQGLEDKVVPPDQSARMADAVRARGVPVAYLSFEGEQHGFRRAATIVRCLEAELAFYGAVCGFTPADAVAPLDIANLASDRKA